MRSLVTDPEDLFIYTKQTSATYRGLLNRIGYATQGLRDWKSTQKIDPDNPAPVGGGLIRRPADRGFRQEM